MNRISRISTALVVATVLVILATGVWAGPGFQGTTPNVPDQGNGGGGGIPVTGGTCAPIDMVTAVFTVTVPSDGANYECVANNISTLNPSEYGQAPENTAFYGDIFKVVVTRDGTEASDVPTQVCYASPPNFEPKEAKTHIWDVDTNTWVEVPGATVSGNPKQICATAGTTGIFSLIGNP